MTTRQQLLEAVSIDASSPADVLNLCARLSKFSVYERVDGLGVYIGVDPSDVVYIAKSSKGQHITKPAQLNPASYDDPYRAALRAVQAFSSIITRHLQPGDAIFCKIVHGAHGRKIVRDTDGLSIIVFQNPHGMTPASRVSALLTNLVGVEASIEERQTTSSDGKTLVSKTTNTTWTFDKVDVHKLTDFNVKSVKALATEMQKWLDEHNDAFPSMTNLQVLTQSLLKSTPALRSAIKQQRVELLKYFDVNYRQALKDILVRKVVRSMHSTVADGDAPVLSATLFDDNGNLLTVSDVETMAIVDGVNNHLIQRINGQVKSISPDEPLATRGGHVGQMRIAILTALGKPAWATPAGMRIAIDAMLAEDSDKDLLEEIQQALNIAATAPEKIAEMLSVCDATVASIDKEISKFIADEQETVELPAGDKHRITTEQRVRILTISAEAIKKVQTLRSAIENKEWGKVCEILCGPALTTRLQTQKEKLMKVNESYGAPVVSAYINMAHSQVLTESVSSMTIGRKTKRYPVMQYITAWAHTHDTDNGQGGVAGQLNESYNPDSISQVRQRLSLLRSNLTRHSPDIPVRTRDIRQYLKTYADLQKFQRTVEFVIETTKGDIIKLFVDADHANSFSDQMQALVNKGVQFDELLKSMVGVYNIVDAEVVCTANEKQQPDLDLVVDTGFKYTKHQNPFGDLSDVSVDNTIQGLRTMKLQESATFDEDFSKLNQSPRFRHTLQIASNNDEKLALIMLMCLGVPHTMILKDRFKIKFGLGRIGAKIGASPDAKAYIRRLLSLTVSHKYSLHESSSESPELFSSLNRTQHIIFSLMNCVGFSLTQLKTHKQQIMASIHRIEKLCTENNEIRRAVLMLFVSLKVENELELETTALDELFPDLFGGK